MNNYTIITDLGKLMSFVHHILPNLEPHEKFYVCLFARSKYCKDIKHISSDKAQLKRFVATKENLIQKIQQLQIPLGRYVQKGQEVPQEALALYIQPNPRNMKKASVNLLVKLAQSIANNDPQPNCHQEALSQIQKAKSRNVYIDFDIDSKDLTPYTISMMLKPILGDKAEFYILLTRGGYHILIKPDTIEEKFKKSWYKTMCEEFEVDQIGDQMIPIPGTYQGGYTPTIFVKNL